MAMRVVDVYVFIVNLLLTSWILHTLVMTNRSAIECHLLIPSSMSRLRILLSIILNILNSVLRPCSPTVILAWSDWFQLRLRLLVSPTIVFERTLAHWGILFCVILTHQILLQNISIAWNLCQSIKIHFIGLNSFIISNFVAIDFDQLWKHFYDVKSIVFYCWTRVVTKPQHFQILKVRQMSYLSDILDIVFP